MKSSEEMASVALGLLTDPQRREQLGREGRKAAVEHHNWDRIAEIYENHSFLATQMLGHEQVCPDLS